MAETTAAQLRLSGGRRRTRACRFAARAGLGPMGCGSAAGSIQAPRARAGAAGPQQGWQGRGGARGAGR